MHLPILSKYIYGKFTLFGLYSFEFVDKKRNTITEIFFMLPPKSKTISEGTRSATMPTLNGNYNLDAGNSTKDVSLAGELFFPYVGSPENPVARDNAGLLNTIDGMTEFFKMQWMLIRYRDYALSKNAKMNVPTSVMNFSPEITALYKRIAKQVNGKIGALYDEIQLIFHDYDMNDHFYCRVKTFMGKQTAMKYNAIEYEIEIECYEPDNKQNRKPATVKQTTNESLDAANTAIQNVSFSDKLDAVQDNLGNNIDILNTALDIELDISNINTENTNIQSGQSTATVVMSTYISSLLTNISNIKTSFLNSYLSASQKEDFDDGDLTLDEILDIDLIAFYNSFQKLKLQVNSIQGIIKSTPVLEDIRYYADANDYKLTTDQFETDGANRIENKTNFYYYIVQENDTSRIIALRELKDASKFVSILRLNDITENDLIDGTLIGQKIKIPVDSSVTGRGEDNLVYEADYTDTDKYLYGSDLATDINKKLRISAKGDLFVKIGIDNVYTNIENRLKNRKGSLNVFNPNWGTVAIDDGNAPLMVKIDRYITDMIEQIQSDPRVESVKSHLDKIEFTGEVLKLPASIFFIGTDESREVII